jgi:pimeloyl-ACP methyl ester carboxylesterase
MENHFKEDFYIPENKLTKGQKLVRFYFKKVGPVLPKTTARLFWRLFTSPRKRKITSVQKEFLGLATKKEYFLPHQKVNYVTHTFGNGSKTVLLCHGWEGMTADFKHLITSIIENDCTLIAIDFPGHGSAPKAQAHLPLFIEVIEDFINHSAEEINFEALIGHSLGAAAIAMTLPKIKKTRVEKVIFLGLHPKPSDFILQYKSITQINQTLFDYCVEYAEKKAKTSLLNYDGLNHIETYSNYTILFVHDEKDTIINVSRIIDFSSKIVSSELFIGRYGGHFKHFKHPEVILNIIGFIVKP